MGWLGQGTGARGRCKEDDSCSEALDSDWQPMVGRVPATGAWWGGAPTESGVLRRGTMPIHAGDGGVVRQTAAHLTHAPRWVQWEDEGI